MRVPFGNLRRQYEIHAGAIDSAIRRVLERGWFVLGDEVREFEKEFASYLGARHVVAVASGTEAIQLALASSGIAEGEKAINALRETGQPPPSYHYRQQELGGAADFLARYLGVRGPAFTVSTTCSSGANALASARRLLALALAVLLPLAVLLLAGTRLVGVLWPVSLRHPLSLRSGGAPCSCPPSISASRYIGFAACCSAKSPITGSLTPPPRRACTFWAISSTSASISRSRPAIVGGPL